MTQHTLHALTHAWVYRSLPRGTGDGTSSRRSSVDTPLYLVHSPLLHLWLIGTEQEEEEGSGGSGANSPLRAMRESLYANKARFHHLFRDTGWPR